jgi:hypothetical protein
MTDEVSDLLRRGMTGEMTVEEVADRLHELGVERVNIESVIVRPPTTGAP